MITTGKCPGGKQGAAYAGCTIAATGGMPPYTFSVDGTTNYPPLPEGLSIDAPSGLISGAQIGGQGIHLGCMDNRVYTHAFVGSVGEVQPAWPKARNSWDAG